MRVLVVGGAKSTPPDGYEQLAAFPLHGRPLRFGRLTRPDTAFDPAADHNRDYALIRIRSFSLGGEDATGLGGPGSGPDPGTWREFGSDFVADVLAVGSAVTTVAPGDRAVPVLRWPPARPDTVSELVPPDTASREVQRIHSARLLRLPAGIPDAAAACLPTAATTGYAMVRRAALTSGDSVLVTAATSPTSLVAVRAAVLRGAEVYALTSTALDGAAAAVLRTMGAVRCFSFTDSADLRELSALARKLRGFDAVVDPLWAAHFPTAVKLLGFDGRYVAGHSALAGRDGGTDWNAAASSLVSKNAEFTGQRLGERADLAAAVEDCRAGRLDIVVDSRFDGDETGPFIRRTLDAARIGGVTYAFTET
ncbi:hypothetical protein [Streptomyces sp. NPDC127033]|uniref:hypothetical protein n=1 Tax=Streptomyces sp. NPDC127033 TaxID=3347110 RepID=UPI0036495DD8